MAMVRKQIYLTAKQDTELKREAKRRGISQAELIRERLSQPRGWTPASPNPEAREALLELLRQVREKAGTGPGTGWKFDRDEIYAERLEKARPGGQQRPNLRRRRA